MSDTAVVYARVDKRLKQNAEGILAQLGISPSNAIQMLYSKIILSRGMPFDLRLPDVKPVAIGAMSREELDAELTKGLESIKNGRLYSEQEIDAEFDREFGL